MQEDQAISEAFELDEELENQELPDDESDEQVGQDEAQQETPKTGADKMFIDKETWVKQGRDPELWVSPDVFRERTERIKLKSQLNQQQREFERRLELNNRMHQVQLDRQRQELEARKENAILEADTKEVKRIDKELRDIDELEQSIKPVPVEQSGIPPEVIEWNAENQWLTADHPLRGQINEAYSNAIAEGKTIAGALRAVDRLAAQLLKSEPAQKKTPRAIVDSPKGGAVVKSQSNLSWSSLTSQEQAIYDEVWADAGVSKKEYLQSVADSKKGL
jgi:hypothetical protein